MLRPSTSRPWNDHRTIWPAFGATAVLAIATLAPQGAWAATVTDPAGDFLATYTGLQGGDLDVLSVSAVLDGTNVVINAVLNGAVGTTPGGAYVLGINRGGGEAFLDAGPTPVGAGVLFDAVAILQPGGPSFVNEIIPPIPVTMQPVTFSFTGDTFRAIIPFADLPSNGFAPADYQYNLWPRMGLDPTNNAQIADFAPDASDFAAGVPEPSSWALLILGFGLAGATLRRRKSAPTVA